MKLPATALLKAPKIEIKDIEVHHLGPKKYFLFGTRKVLCTERLPGRMVISNGLVDFGDLSITPGTKIPVLHIGDKAYVGVTPVHQVDYSSKWWCCIDALTTGQQ